MTGIMYGERLGATTVEGLEIGVTPGPPPGTVHVCVSGEIDLHNAAALRETLLIALTSHRGNLLLDLQQVGFCDCAGLNALLTVRLASIRAGRRLRITAASRPVERLLQLADSRPFLV